MATLAHTPPLSPEQLHSLLTAAFPGAELSVRDDTHLHADHNKDVNHFGGHYRVRIVWAGFAGQPRVQRHRRVQQALAAAWANGQIHALSLVLLTPQEAQSRTSSP